MARPAATEPDLVAEIRRLQARIDALERKPVPQTIFDQYPSTEWAAINRPTTGGNTWASCGVANVTGLKYDRVEVKYLTDHVLTGRSEAEVRLAAFRHEYGSQAKTCVSASSVLRLSGSTTRTVGVGKWRWIHGLQFGWGYSSDDNAIYTIELQHRNPDDCIAKPDAGTQVFAHFKSSNANPPAGFGDWIGLSIPNDSGAQYRFVGQRRTGSNPTWPGDAGWVTAINGWDGSYAISNMHYCAGLSQARLPTATTAGYHWYTGGGSSVVRAGDISERHMGF